MGVFWVSWGREGEETGMAWMQGGELSGKRIFIKLSLKMNRTKILISKVVVIFRKKVSRVETKF